MSSADTTPISPARFAAALKDLSEPMLHLKVLEIRNSIAHLQYSNDQLRPFADGTASATDSTAAGEPDADCVEAIAENEQVMARMAERIALIRMEVEEERGMAWADFERTETTEEAAARGRAEQEAKEKQREEAEEEEEEEEESIAARVNGDAERRAAAGAGTSPWTDGTFQTGTIRNGEVRLDAQPGVRGGGSLSDEQLRAAMEERMRQMTTDDDDEDGGLHL